MIEIQLENEILQKVIDSGTQISIIKSSCVKEYFKTHFGSVILKSAFAHQLKAPLINIPLSIAADKLHYRVFPKIGNNMRNG